MAGSNASPRSKRSRPDAGARAEASAALLAEGRLTYPDSLPITERHDELLDLIRSNQVMIVAGETGSGKSTQIPKLCLEAGRGVSGLIGHTQPRRVAARSIAERVAEELGSSLGDDVGYTVRFTDKVSNRTLVKVMTDGILLAEIQRDRMLRRYDTLIIDEAHERSLNIDFILGYLKQLLPKRPDLHVIVTSATIDTERFAAHFSAPPADDPNGDPVPAPIVAVTGRTFPVEVRYRPYGPDNEDDPDDRRDQVQAVIDAVDELSVLGDGDVLVFLSGEREIHDIAGAMRQIDTAAWRATDILPLYARLSSVEQQRVFKTSKRRRIVLSTNVAETSLTVPGVRYVVDAGTARISRYSKRLKVQRLPIEPVSQASANQRSGRCGRVAPGVAIRLYAEDEFVERPEFTDPEILRTNLASVILQMTAIGLGDVGMFPFVEPPERSMIRDGYALLDELAAIEPADRDDPERHLTRIGRDLAKLPVDPRLGRMVLEADEFGCVREVLVIASALSIQDPRERPQEKIEQANEFHNRFKVDGSDLLSLVELWDYLRNQQRELSGNQFRRMCRKEYLNYLRVREWMDLYSQLRRVAGELKIRPHRTPEVDKTHPDHVHRSLLAGLLSQVGMRERETRDYRGARDARFVIARGSVIGRKQPDWVMAAELVETNRLYARRVAAIEPEWIEQAAAHLVKKSHSDPRWDAKAGRAVITEQVTLFGLPIVSDRKVGYDKIDIDAARAWFITKALVEGEWHTQQKFVTRNQEFLEGIGAMAARVRRTELVDDAMLFAFFDERLDADVTDTRRFDRWWKEERQRNGRLLDLTEELLADREHGVGIRLADFPEVWRQGDIELPLTYRYAPGEPLDGVTVHIPLSALNQIEPTGFDWQIAGHRREVIAMLVRSVPKHIRRELTPMAETIDATVERVADFEPGSMPLVHAVAVGLTRASGIRIDPSMFNTEVLDNFLRMNFVVTDEHGEVRDVGTDLAAIKARRVGEARESIAAAAPIEERRGIVAWDIGDLPRTVQSDDRALDVVGYPTLLDIGDSVALRVVTSADVQRRAMRGGVRRLLLLTAAPSRKVVERLLTNAGKLALGAADVSVAALADDCIAAAVDHLLEDHLARGGTLPWSEVEFEELRAQVARDVPTLARDALVQATAAVAATGSVHAKLASLRAAALQPSVDDANLHLGRLVRPGFVFHTGLRQLPEIERYVRSIDHRLDNLAGGVERDRRRIAEVAPLEARYAALLDRLPASEVTSEVAAVAWQLEELRVSVFAQPLGAKGQPSPTKLARSLDGLGG